MRGKEKAYEGVEGRAGLGEGGELGDVEVADDEDEQVVRQLEQAHRGKYSRICRTNTGRVNKKPR